MVFFMREQSPFMIPVCFHFWLWQFSEWLRKRSLNYLSLCVWWYLLWVWWHSGVYGGNIDFIARTPDSSYYISDTTVNCSIQCWPRLNHSCTNMYTHNRVDQYIGLYLYPQYKKRPMYWSNNRGLKITNYKLYCVIGALGSQSLVAPNINFVLLWNFHPLLCCKN